MPSTNDGTKSNKQVVNVDATNGNLVVTVVYDLPQNGMIMIGGNASLSVTVDGTTSTASAVGSQPTCYYNDSTNVPFVGQALKAQVADVDFLQTDAYSKITLGNIRIPNVTQTMINTSANRILTVNGKAIETFDEWLASINWDSSINQSVIDQVTSTLKQYYPKVWSSDDENLPFPVKCLINDWGNINHDAQTIKNYLTSLDISNSSTPNYLSIGDIGIYSNTSTIGVTPSDASINNPSISCAFSGTLQSNVSYRLQDSWSAQNALTGPDSSEPDWFSYLAMNGSNFNNQLGSWLGVIQASQSVKTWIMKYPSLSQFSSNSYLKYWGGTSPNPPSTSFNHNPSIPSVAYPRMADYFSMLLSAATTPVGANPIKWSCNPVPISANGYDLSAISACSLYSYESGSNNFTVPAGAPIQLGGGITQGIPNYTSSDNVAYVFAFWYVTGSNSGSYFASNLNDTLVQSLIQQGSFSLGSQQTGIAYMLTGDTFESVTWAIPCNGLTNDIIIGQEISNAYAALGISIQGYGQLSASTYTQSDPLYYSASVTNISVPTLSVLQPYSLSCTMTVDDVAYKTPSKAKKQRHSSVNSFDAMAKKVLSLRDELNAKLVSDLSCKVMNASSLTNICKNYPSYISLINSLPPGEFPTRTDVHNIIGLFLLSALDLGIYPQFITQMYTHWPYTEIPSYFSQCWSYANSVSLIQSDFPWTTQQLTNLVNWYFMFPSETKLSATHTQSQSYDQDPADHVFVTHSLSIKNKILDVYNAHILPDFEHMKDTLDPSIDEIRYAFTDMETVATGLLTLGSLTTIIKSAKSALHSTLQSNSVGSLQELQSKFPDSFSSFKQQWQSMIQAHSNTASTQYDKYDHIFFVPDSSVHKQALKEVTPMIDSIFSALYTLTWDNSHVIDQINQFCHDLTSKRWKSIDSLLTKLGNDLLRFDPFKIVDNILGDIVQDGVDIMVDALKAVKMLASDILKGLADIVSPSSMVVRLWNDLHTLVYNDFSMIPDVNNQINENASHPIGSFFPLYYPIGGGTGNLSVDTVFGVQDLNGCSWSIDEPTSSFESRPTWTLSFPKNLSSPVTFKVIKPYDTSTATRYTIHLACGDAFVYVLYNCQNNNWSISNANNNFGGIYIEPVPVKSDTGIIDPLMTQKSMCELIYHLPELFHCEGLLSLDSYKNVWTQFIQSIGSVAWANDTPHISIDEMNLAESAGYGVSAIYGALSIADGFSLNINGMLSNGVMSAETAAETYEWQQHAYKVNSEPNIYDFNSNVLALLDVVWNAIYYWTQWSTYYPSFDLSGVTNKNLQLNDLYLKLDHNHQQIELAKFFNALNSDVDTIPELYANNMYKFNCAQVSCTTNQQTGDMMYGPITIAIDPESDFRFSDESSAVSTTTSSGTIDLITPVYTPSIVYNFEKVIFTLGEAASALYIQKKIADIFTDGVSRSAKLAALRSKVKSTIAPGSKAAKFLNKYAWAKHHRDHNSKARANLINSQTSSIESALTTQTTDLSGDINGMNIPGSTWGIN